MFLGMIISAYRYDRVVDEKMEAVAQIPKRSSD